MLALLAECHERKAAIDFGVSEREGEAGSRGGKMPILHEAPPAAGTQHTQKPRMLE